MSKSALWQIDRPIEKKGSTELLIPLAGRSKGAPWDIEISKMIEIGSAGDLCFNAASLYPLLYRLEQRGWIEGRRIEKPNQRKRRYYRITTGGRKIPREKRSTCRSL